MSSFKPLFHLDQATIDSLAMYAVGNNNPDMMKCLIDAGPPTNLKQCFDIANENKYISLIILLLKYAGLAPTSPPPIAPLITPPTTTSQAVSDVVAKPRPLKIIDTSETYVRWKFQLGNKNSQFMLDILLNPVLALKDLDAGLISKAELNYQNKTTAPVLCYLCSVSHRKDHVAIIEKMISLGANLNVLDDYGWTPLMFLMYNKYNSNHIEHILDLFLTNSSLQDIPSSQVIDGCHYISGPANESQFTNVLAIALREYKHLSLRIVTKLISYLSQLPNFRIAFWKNKMILDAINDIEAMGVKHRDEQMICESKEIYMLYTTKLRTD